MRVAVVHNEIKRGEQDPDTVDVLVQARHVNATLAEAGHVAELFSLCDNPADVIRELRAFGAERIFNLVESVRGKAAAHPRAAAIWEAAGIPHTGSSSAALMLTTDKPLSKGLLEASGIPTPSWTVWDREVEALDLPEGPWIIKPACEDASVGIDEDSVARDRVSLEAKLRALGRRFPDQEILVEHYVEGREFNVSLLASGGGPLVLPPAEIVFDSYPEGKERVVGYRAKWDETSFEYDHTVRRFDFPSEDGPLLERVRETGLRCWELFKLSGYARVDSRVDEELRVQVVEVNANPCLSPGGGFTAAVLGAGISPARMVEMILEDVV